MTMDERKRTWRERLDSFLDTWADKRWTLEAANEYEWLKLEEGELRAEDRQRAA